MKTITANGGTKTTSPSHEKKKKKILEEFKEKQHNLTQTLESYSNTTLSSQISINNVITATTSKAVLPLIQLMPCSSLHLLLLLRLTFQEIKTLFSIESHILKEEIQPGGESTEHVPLKIPSKPTRLIAESISGNLEAGRSLTHLLNSWGCSAWCAASFRLSSQVHLEGWGGEWLLTLRWVDSWAVLAHLEGNKQTHTYTVNTSSLQRSNMSSTDQWGTVQPLLLPLGSCLGVQDRAADWACSSNRCPGRSFSPISGPPWNYVQRCAVRLGLLSAVRGEEVWRHSVDINITLQRLLSAALISRLTQKW